MLINISITARIQYPFLIVLSVAAMLLLVRINLVHQQLGWRRRHIGDGSDVSGLFLRGGVLFVALTLVGAMHAGRNRELGATRQRSGGTWTTSSWPSASRCNRLVGGVTGSTKQTGGLFSSAETIRGFWESDQRVIFTDLPADGQGHYWRGAAYDTFDGQTWSQTDRQSVDVAAGQNLLAGARTTSRSDRRPRTGQITVTSLDLAGGTLLAPDSPYKVDHATHVRTDGQGGPLLTIDFDGAISPGDTYTVTSLQPTTDPRTGITAADLAGAGVDYPAWAEPYIDVPPNTLGQAAIGIADRWSRSCRQTSEIPTTSRRPSSGTSTTRAGSFTGPTCVACAAARASSTA